MLLYNAWSQHVAALLKLLSRLCTFNLEGEATTSRVLGEQDCLGFDVVHQCTAFGLQQDLQEDSSSNSAQSDGVLV